MTQSYYLQDITLEAAKNPRQFMAPTETEIAGLQVGEKVRLFFVFNFETNDGCRAERMWVEIAERNGDNFKGYLTNQPVYIKDLQTGDLVSFNKTNIATIIIPAAFNEEKKAIITRRALEKKAVNWLVAGEPYNTEDSGWQLFHGDEDDAYLEDSENAVLVSLKEVLGFEPRLEKAFASKHNAFEWSEQQGDFVEVRDYV